MAQYKIVKVDNNIQTEMVLSDSDFNVITTALQVYENHLIDSEPVSGESDDVSDYDIWEIESVEYENFDYRFMEFMNE